MPCAGILMISVDEAVQYQIERVPSMEPHISRAEVDMNVVMSSEGRFVEVQGTGEHGTFARAELDRLQIPYIAGVKDAPSMRGFTVAAKAGSACAEWLKANGVASIRTICGTPLRNV